MHQGTGTGLAENRQVALVLLVVCAAIVVMRAGHDCGGAVFQGDVLWVVEDHHPAIAVIAHLVIAPVAVLVPATALAAGAIDVAVAVGVHDVILPDHRSEGTAHDRVVKNLLQRRDAGQNVVAGIALLGKDLFGALIDVLVEGSGQRGFEREIALGYKLLHLLVAEEVLRV